MYCNFKNYFALEAAVLAESDPDDYILFEDMSKQCLKYVESVKAHESALGLIRFRYEAETLIRMVEEADQARRIIHNAAIANCNVFNRLAALYNIGSIFEGNVEDRYQVADFCEEIAVTITWATKVRG